MENELVRDRSGNSRISFEAISVVWKEEEGLK